MAQLTLEETRISGERDGLRAPVKKKILRLISKQQDNTETGAGDQEI